MLRTFKQEIIPEDPNIMLRTMELYSLVFNEHIKWSKDNNSRSKSKAHKELYLILREKYPELPSPFIQTARDNALEAIKQTKNRRNIKKQTLSIRYDRRTSNLIKKKGYITLSSVGKRQKISYNIPDFFKPIYENWKFKAAQMTYNKGRFYLSMIFFTETPIKSLGDSVLGIDRGIYNIVSLSDGTNITGREIRKQKRKYLYNKRKLQSKGNPSAKRKLKLVGNKESRFTIDKNHCISKKIVNLDYDVFVLENLKGIRNRRKGKKINKWLSNWSFFQLQSFLEYKAEAKGKSVVYISPEFTSQTCSVCGYIDKENRNKSIFQCTKCNHKENADINAAKNIKHKFIFKQELEAGGSQSTNHISCVPLDISHESCTHGC